MTLTVRTQFIYRTSCFHVYLILVSSIYNKVSSMDEQFDGPIFLQKFPAHLNFLSTSSTMLHCSVYGQPQPYVYWYKDDIDKPVIDIPELRVSLSNGSLLFKAFDGNLYDQSVHAKSYRCKAENSNGVIVSPRITVRAVVPQEYMAQVNNEFVIEGNTAILHCRVPSYVVDYVKVISWITEDNTLIKPSSILGSSRYSIYENGYLHIRNVSLSDNGRGYRCQTIYSLSQESQMSQNMGRIYVQERKSSSAPSITHTEIKITATSGTTARLPCASQGLPIPLYRWYKEVEKREDYLQNSLKYKEISGTLYIANAKLNDSGIYVCKVSNSIGSRTTKTELIVTEILEAYMNETVQSADVGGRVSFFCHTQGGPITKGIRWYHNGKEIDVEDMPRFAFSNDQRMLSISPISRQDGGIYQCIIKNNVETALAIGQLKLGAIIPMIIKGFDKKLLQPGPTVKLQCKFTGDPLPDVYWYLEDKLMDEKDPDINIKYELSENDHTILITSLTINKIKAKDGGKYKCEAINSAGMAQHSARIDIYGVPKVRQMKNLTVVEGKNLIVHCHIYGYPIHSITWNKDGKELKSRIPGRRTRSMKLTENGELQIISANRLLDSGKYSCTASNRLGQKSVGFLYVNIIRRPELKTITKSETIRQGDVINLYCSLNSGDSPIAFQWFKDDEEIMLYGDISVNHDTRYSMLTIRSADRGHSGRYTCEATNKAGSDHKSTQVMVIVNSNWIYKSPNVEGIASNEVNLTCKAEGSPSPNITWFRIDEDKELYTLKNGLKYKFDRRGSLTIKDLTIYDSGEYECQAWNGLSLPISHQFEVYVKTAPKIIIKHEIQNTTVNSDVMMDCKVLGDRPLTVIWNKLGSTKDLANAKSFKIQEENNGSIITSKITINKVSMENDGVYLCIARNEFGEDRKSIKLKVSNLPETPDDVEIHAINGSVILVTWKQLHETRTNEVEYYVLEYKLVEGDWNNATKVKVKDKNKTRFIYIDIIIGFEYNLRVYAATENFKSRPSPILTFKLNENGTLIQKETHYSSINQESSRNLMKILIPWIASIFAVILALISISVWVLFIVKRNSKSQRNKGNRRSEDTTKSLLSSTLNRNKQNEQDRYGQVLTSIASDDKPPQLYENTDPLNYIYNPSSIATNYYSEIDISPYATFKLPQPGSIKKSNTEMTTFSRYSEVQEA